MHWHIGPPPPPPLQGCPLTSQGDHCHSTKTRSHKEYCSIARYQSLITPWMPACVTHCPHFPYFLAVAFSSSCLSLLLISIRSLCGGLYVRNVTMCEQCGFDFTRLIPVACVTVDFWPSFELAFDYSNNASRWWYIAINARARQRTHPKKRPPSANVGSW